VKTDRDKEFLNRTVRDMLKPEGIQFYVCRNPDMKCAVMERAHRTIRNKLCRYLTYKSTYRLIDVLLQFIKAYDTAHTTTRMTPAAVYEKHVLEI